LKSNITKEQAQSALNLTAGISALSIIGLDTTFTSGDVPYHTNFDTVDKIEPEAVLACMQITEQLIIEIDKPS